MENLSNTASHVMEDFRAEGLSRTEKQKISRQLSADLAAVTCLVAGLIYKLLFPRQAVVAGLIYSVGILIEAVPLLITAVMYLIMVMIFSWLQGKLERRLRQSDRR